MTLRCSIWFHHVVCKKALFDYWSIIIYFVLVMTLSRLHVKIVLGLASLWYVVIIISLVLFSGVPLQRWGLLYWPPQLLIQKALIASNLMCNLMLQDAVQTITYKDARLSHHVKLVFNFHFQTCFKIPGQDNNKNSKISTTRWSQMPGFALFLLLILNFVLVCAFHY